MTCIEGHDLIGFPRFKKTSITMQITNILQELLSSTIHQTRIKSLIPIIEGIITTKKLKLSPLGRDLDIEGQERAGIRRVDRLLSNSYYQKQASDIYSAITQYVVNNQSRPIILVDWTSIPNSLHSPKVGAYCVLRASLISEGRSITLYEEVHSKRNEGTDKVHQKFLSNLKEILPKKCRPYIVTDAGFKNPWFKAVLAQNWDYVGRVRGKVNYDSGNGFEPIKCLHKNACGTPKAIGSILLSQRNQLKTNCYLYSHTLKGRERLTKGGTKSQKSVAKKAASGYREPWILVSSMKGCTALSKVIKMYQFRMTIEGSFRDAKSEEFGFSLNENKTIKPERYVVWLLISTLAYLVAWIVGFAAEQAQMHYDFQANTYQHRRVLSFFYLGCRIIKRKKDIIIDLTIIRFAAWDELSWTILC